MRPPDFLSLDPSSAFTSKENIQSVEVAGITLKDAPIENPRSTSVVEMYHGPIKKAYLDIRSTLPKNEDVDEECLSMETNAPKATILPEGIWDMRLVFVSIRHPERKNS